MHVQISVSLAHRCHMSLSVFRTKSCLPSKAFFQALLRVICPNKQDSLFSFCNSERRLSHSCSIASSFRDFSHSSQSKCNQKGANHKIKWSLCQISQRILYSIIKMWNIFQASKLASCNQHGVLKCFKGFYLHNIQNKNWIAICKKEIKTLLSILTSILKPKMDL